jgi:hypothetical protein
VQPAVGERNKLKKGEEGYWERNTDAAHEAAARSHAIFPDADVYQHEVNRYFDECDANGSLYGEAGLCRYLSEHNLAQKTVTLETLRKWCDGETSTHLQEATQLAYLRIQEQIETDPRYREKGMVPRSIFLQKQKRFGGYQDRIETKNDTTFRLELGTSMDASDLE